MVTDSERTSNRRLCPFAPVESFEHAKNFPSDGTDIKGYQRTRNGFTGLETDIKRIQPDMKGCSDFLTVSRPLAQCDRNFKPLFKNCMFLGDNCKHHFHLGRCFMDLMVGNFLSR